MIFQINPHAGIPIYRQVIDQIRHQIITGAMVPGEQLESVKNLSNRLKVNPMTISKAYGFLVQEGLVERRRGVGLFVNRLHGRKRTKLQSQLLDEAFRKVAALTVQMDIPEEEALLLFSKCYRGLAARKEHRDDTP